MSSDQSKKPNLVEQLANGKGATAGKAPSGTERRSHRRFDISKSESWISTIPPFSLVDVSASGAGLVAPYPVRIGEIVRVAVKGGPSADALVVYCRLGEMNTISIISEFHVGCRFISRKEAEELNSRIEYQLASLLG